MSKLTDNLDANFQLFIEEVRESGQVWGLRYGEDWVVCRSAEFEDADVMPLWSAEGDARLHCVDEWADYLATFITTVPDPRRYARERLLGELAEYGNLARSRFPADSRTAATGAGKYEGEDDANEFNTPATKLLYPSSWYTYGASDGLRAAVERTADRRQVEYFAALLAAPAAGAAEPDEPDDTPGPG